MPEMLSILHVSSTYCFSKRGKHTVFVFTAVLLQLGEAVLSKCHAKFNKKLIQVVDNCFKYFFA